MQLSVCRKCNSLCVESVVCRDDFYAMLRKVERSQRATVRGTSSAGNHECIDVPSRRAFVDVIEPLGGLATRIQRMMLSISEHVISR
jgi:hypothetical protein